MLHCLEHYLGDDERRYGAEFDGAGVPWDYTSARLLGLDARHLLDDSTRSSISAVLARFGGPDARVVGLASDPGGRRWVEDHRRNQAFDLFRWYRRGLLRSAPFASCAADAACRPTRDFPSMRNRGRVLDLVTPVLRG